MNKKLIPAGAALFLILMTACAKVTSAPEAAPTVMPGGYSKVPVTDERVVAAAAFAIDTERQALKAAGEPAQLQLLSLVGAEQQVVAGMNYRLNLKVTRNGKEQLADAVVWWQAWRQPDPFRLTSWQWK
jgi:curli biogenesis system outer membrane secretion channel CsgG